MHRSTLMKREGGEAGFVSYRAESGHEAALQTITVRASALAEPPPDEIRVIIQWSTDMPAESEAGESAQAPGRPTVGGTKPAQREIRKGDRVRVVKSRVSSAKSPPEWLEQYVGRTGVVVLTTADGAEVNLGTKTTWFSFAELVRED
jgi:hypothetical protein